MSRSIGRQKCEGPEAAQSGFASGRATKKDTVRIDKWLFHARFYRSRALAQAAARAGRLRLNGARVEKPGHGVAPGDILTLSLPRAHNREGPGRDVVAVRVLALAERRGPAREAQLLYEILADPALDMHAKRP